MHEFVIANVWEMPEVEQRKCGREKVGDSRSTMMSNSRSSSRCVITANKWRKPRSDHDNLRSPATRQKQPSSDQKGERKSGHQLN